jgi:hypothetical protein
VVLARSFVRLMSGVLWTPVFSVCMAAAPLSLPSRPAMERECVTANAQSRLAVCLVSDLDGDRQADYALSLDITGLFVRPASISIHLSSTLETYRLFLPDGLAASSFVFRDVNGDGQLDIALLGGFNETVGVFLNDGSGGFRFDRQDRYLTPPNHDLSEMSPPPRLRSCDCAEPGSGSSCALSAYDVAAHRLPAARVRFVETQSTPARPSPNAARSRAP